MPGLIIHQSNHVESLAEALTGELAVYNRDPLTPVTIVVQSRGMERWLSIELAQRMGLIANARFPFPNTILSEIFTAVMVDASQTNLFETDTLTFRAMKTLPSCLAEESFAPLQEYISKSDDDLRRFQLCQKIATMYDQLATFRPEVIRAWDLGDFDSWHGSLWNRMFDDSERQGHRPALFHQVPLFFPPFIFRRVPTGPLLGHSLSRRICKVVWVEKRLQGRAHWWEERLEVVDPRRRW